MEINIITVFYHPLFFLKDSLQNNYRLLKKDNIKFNHYLLDNNYPLELNKQEELKKLCDSYQIKYINIGENLGVVHSIDYFHKVIKLKNIVFHMETDAYLLSENILKNIQLTHSNHSMENLFYLNNKNLDNHEKNIFQINGVNYFELNVENLNHTWIQCWHKNANMAEKIQSVFDNDQRTNYDVPGEKQKEFKKQNIPLLIMADCYEDMDRYRFSNYFEYEYFKALVYYWSKFEDEFKNLTFENFIKNYDYYFEMDKFNYCFRNFKMRTKDLNIKPNFYFEKTKTKFNVLYSRSIIDKVGAAKKVEIMKKIKIKKILF